MPAPPASSSGPASRPSRRRARDRRARVRDGSRRAGIVPPQDFLAADIPCYARPMAEKVAAKPSADLMFLLSQTSHALMIELTARLAELGISPRSHCVLSH